MPLFLSPGYEPQFGHAELDRVPSIHACCVIRLLNILFHYHRLLGKSYANGENKVQCWIV